MDGCQFGQRQHLITVKASTGHGPFLPGLGRELAGVRILPSDSSASPTSMVIFRNLWNMLVHDQFKLENFSNLPDSFRIPKIWESLHPLSTSSLSPEARTTVESATRRLHELEKRTSESIIEMGQHLIAVKSKIGHGQFLPWLDREFGWSRVTAHNLMQVADQFGGKSSTVEHLGAKVLYLLAAPSTPEEVRVEFTELAAIGKAVKHKDVQQAIAERKQRKADPIPCIVASTTGPEYPSALFAPAGGSWPRGSHHPGGTSPDEVPRHPPCRESGSVLGAVASPSHAHRCACSAAGMRTATPGHEESTTHRQ